MVLSPQKCCCTAQTSIANLHSYIYIQYIFFLPTASYFLFRLLGQRYSWQLRQQKMKSTNRSTRGGHSTRPACQRSVLRSNFSARCADLLNCEASRSLLPEEQSPDLASARQVGEIRDNRIKARGGFRSFRPLAEIMGFPTRQLPRTHRICKASDFSII